MKMSHFCIIRQMEPVGELVIYASLFVHIQGKTYSATFRWIVGKPGDGISEDIMLMN